MHQAYIAHEVLTQLPLDITSIAACSNNVVFVGTKDSRLVIYTITPDPSVAPSKPPFHISLSKSQSKFSTGPIAQMVAVDELQLLISLSNLVNVHSIKAYKRTQRDSRQEQLPLMCQVGDSRSGAAPSLFAINLRYDSKDEVNLQMCVAYKKLAQIYEWREKEFLPLKTLPTLPDILRSMVLTKKYLYCGFAKEYYQISLRDGHQKVLIDVGNNMGPIVAKLGSEAIAVGYDNQLIPLSYEGESIYREALKFSAAPITILHDEPYIIALTESSLEIKPFMQEGVLAQRVDIRSPLSVCISDRIIWVASKTSVWRLAQVPAEHQITALASNKQFKLAELMAEKGQEQKDPEKKRTKINLIRTLDALDKFNKCEYEAAFNIFKQLRANPIHILGLYPELIALKMLSKFTYPVEIGQISKKELNKAISVLVKYLQLTRKELIEKERKGNTNVSATEYFALANTTEEIPNIFTVGILREVVDTALLKCFVITNDAEAGNLLRLENNRCNYETTVKTLDGKRKYKELVIFYETRKKHREALQLLKDLSGQTNSSLSGHETTVSYLQKLGSDHLDVIFEFSKWVLMSFPKDGLQIFTDDSPQCEGLPPNKVVKFLKDISNKLSIHYLEHIINKRGLQEPQYHNMLALAYKDEILKQLHEYVDSLSEGDEPARAGQEPGELGVLRNKLMAFLTESIYYDPRELLVSFPVDSLYIEQAILNGRMGNHDKALSIYIHVLKDKKQAEAYCSSIVAKKLESSNWENVYFSLFDTYIDPKTNAIIVFTTQSLKPDVKSALDVLENHWDMINMEKALKKLPDTVPLASLETYLENVLRRTTNQKRDDQVLKNLLSYESMRYQKELHGHLAEKFDLSEDVCEQCRNKIGNSKFVRMPPEHEEMTNRRKLLHLNCYKNYRIQEENSVYRARSAADRF